MTTNKTPYKISSSKKRLVFYEFMLYPALTPSYHKYKTPNASINLVADGYDLIMKFFQNLFRDWILKVLLILGFVFKELLNCEAHCKMENNYQTLFDPLPS